MTREEAENLKPGDIIHGDFDNGEYYTIYSSKIDGNKLEWIIKEGGTKHRWEYINIKIFLKPESIINNYEIC